MKNSRTIEPLEDRIAPATLIGLTDSNQVVAFDSNSPVLASIPIPVQGLGAGETLIGIDFRPATGALYGITIDGNNVGRAYLIELDVNNLDTVVATFSSLLVADPSDASSPYTSLSGANFGVDFNPVPDRLRVVSDTAQNLRINVDTGFVITDGDINPSTALSGAAYANSFAGAAATTLYDIDLANDRLVIQNPPNNGTLAAVGTGLGIGDVTGVGGFDILSARTADGTVTNTAFAALTADGVTGLYSIDLASGAATNLGMIGNGSLPLRGLTSPTGSPSANAFTIDGTQHLLGFNTATPNLTTDVGAVTGIGAGEFIMAFDFRPANGQLYAVTRDLAGIGHIYTINTSTAAATLVSTLVADPADSTNPYTALATSTTVGADFNPVPDRLRVVTSSGQNLRINVDNGFVTTDGDLNPGTPDIFAVAYTNSFSGAATTTLYGIDSTTDQLVIQNPPNNGTLTVVGSLGVNITGVGGFDIRPNGEAFATLQVGLNTAFYRIDLTTGAATLVGQMGAGDPTLGFSIAPSGSFQFNPPGLASVSEGASFGTFTVTRVGGTDGTVSVLVTTANGSALGGSDYTPVTKILTFGPGVTTQSFDVPIASDILIEGNETFTATLSPLSDLGPVDAAKATATITILDDEPVAPAANFIGLDNANHLLKFSSASSGTVASTVTVTGLGAGETLVGIDFRPATGGLYGITVDGAQAGRVYLIDPTTGAAVFSAKLTADPSDTTSPYATLNGANFGMDFNPVPDRVRLVSDTAQNLRINVDTGFVITDSSISPPTALSGVAYANSFAGAASTTLYDIDTVGNQLVVQNPPNDGTLNPIGGLGFDITGVGGFDILTHRAADGSATQTGYAALTVNGVTGLYAIDLTTGAASAFGSIGDGSVQLRGLTTPTGTPSANAFTIDGTEHLLRFNTATPNLTTDVGTVSGIGAGEAILAFDFRPANGQLYAVTRDLLGTGHIYTINTSTAAATLVSTLVADPSDSTSPYTALATSTLVGADFNPVPDRLRVVTSSGQNLRINVDNGFVTTDGDLNPGTPSIFGVAYTNSFSGATTTTLYGIDSATDQLVIQNPPNNGTLTVVGNLGVDVTGVGGFDIRPNGEAFATLQIGLNTGLYHIDLATGAATLVGQMGSGDPTLGFSIAPNGTLQFSASALTFAEDAGTAAVTINRIGGSDGVVSVIITTAGGTATPGADYTGLSQVVTFGAGVTSQVINIPLFDDAIHEGNETFALTLAAANGGASLNNLNIATATLVDNETLPTLSIADVSKAEGSNGPTLFSFLVTLSGPSSSAVTVNYATTAGNATDGSDYTGTTGVLTIPAGMTTGVINVSVDGDTVFEVIENFTVTLSNPNANATIADGTATGTILNDDANSIKGKVASYTDPEGDLVTIKISKGTLTADNFVFQPTGTQGGLQLVELNFNDDAFLNGNLTLTAKRSSAGGDGFANVGFINAAGFALGKVSINGDVGRVDALSMKALTAQSIGRFGTSTQAPGGSLTSHFSQGLGKLVVKSDITDAVISTPASIKSMTVGGNLTDSSIIAQAAGKISIRGDIDSSEILLSGINSPPSTKAASALSGLVVGGSVRDASILIGYDENGLPVNADVQAGSLSVGGDWISSDLAVGIDAGTDDLFGTSDDHLIAGGGSIAARIAKISVRGQVLGTIGSAGDAFGFVAEQIGSFTTGPTKLKFTGGPDNFAIGSTGDVTVREYTT